MRFSELTRRAFLKVSLTLSGIVSIFGIFKYLSYTEPPKFATRLTLASPDAYPPGSVTPVPEARAWVIRDDDGLYALTGVCTHLGCTVQQADDHFECPCHGSRFTLSGSVLTGPAISPLQHVELSLSPDGSLALDTQVVVPPNQRVS